MSYWGAQVIVNLFDAIPVIGPDLAIWIRGDFVVSDATLNRFFAYHVIAVPLALLALVVAHLLALHEVGSSNPDGVEIKNVKDPKTGKPLDGIPFHPYYTVKDTFGVVVLLIVFSIVVFFAPEAGGYFLEHNNFIPADPLKTPAHIAPVWYFTPYYSILRADRKSTRLNSSHLVISYAVFCLKKKNQLLTCARASRIYPSASPTYEPGERADTRLLTPPLASFASGAGGTLRTHGPLFARHSLN